MPPHTEQVGLSQTSRCFSDPPRLAHGFPKAELCWETSENPPKSQGRESFFATGYFIQLLSIPPFSDPAPKRIKVQWAIFGSDTSTQPEDVMWGPENWGCRMPRSIELVQIIYTQYIYMYILRTTKGCGISNFGYSHVMGAFHLRAYALKKL